MERSKQWQKLKQECCRHECITNSLSILAAGSRSSARAGGVIRTGVHLSFLPRTRIPQSVMLQESRIGFKLETWEWLIGGVVLESE